MEGCLRLKESSLLELVSMSVSVSLGGKCNLVYLGRIDTSCSLVTVQLMQLCHSNWLNTQSVKCRTDYKWDGEVGISCWSALRLLWYERCLRGRPVSWVKFIATLLVTVNLSLGVGGCCYFFCIQKLDKTNKSVLKLFELTFCRKLSFILYLTKWNTFP